MILSFFFFDLYRGMWRYTGIIDLTNVIKGVTSGSLLFVGYLAGWYHFKGFSRSVILVDFVFSIVAIGALRLFVRLYYQRQPHFFHEIIFRHKAQRNLRKVLILGTGPLAERLLRELQGMIQPNHMIIGFIDADQGHKGMKIHGVPIMGSLDDIPDLVRYYEIDDILITLPETTGNKIKMLIETCSGQKVCFKVIPSLTDRINGAIADHLRDIKVEDLLEREPVKLDMTLVRNELEGKVVLVTGAGGSIGSELARQIMRFDPDTLILLDNAETPLYNIDMELSRDPGNTRVVPCIGDIRTFKGLDRIFRQYKPEIVYHAAAYKHVTMMELTPLDAANNNILGTYKLATVACRHNVEKFVMISTDKAVRPTSIMGATKRVAEMVVQSLNGCGTRFAVVRFGNVLGSNGSVVPLFEKQIATGGPVTVTDPEVTRYFMTIPEAAMLVLFAGSIGKGGELFLLDMGEPVKIVDLAKNMIRLAGLVPEKDIEIEFIGLRPGEKLYEELLIAGEDVIDSAYKKIKICRNVDNIDENELFAGIERFSLLVKDSCDQKAAVDILKKLVPSYSGGTYEMLDKPDSKANHHYRVHNAKTHERGKKVI
jgi:FlaA1/EpsC-like NDP-sugar epimerase